jgi:hypothetical protein
MDSSLLLMNFSSKTVGTNYHTYKIDYVPQIKSAIYLITGINFLIVTSIRCCGHKITSVTRIIHTWDPVRNTNHTQCAVLLFSIFTKLTGPLMNTVNTNSKFHRTPVNFQPLEANTNGSVTSNSSQALRLLFISSRYSQFWCKMRGEFALSSVRSCYKIQHYYSLTN